MKFHFKGEEYTSIPHEPEKDNTDDIKLEEVTIILLGFVYAFILGVLIGIFINLTIRGL